MNLQIHACEFAERTPCDKPQFYDVADSDRDVGQHGGTTAAGGQVKRRRSAEGVSVEE